MHLQYGSLRTALRAAQAFAMLLALAPAVRGIQDQEGEVLAGLTRTLWAQDGGAPLLETVERIVSHDFGMRSPHELVPQDGFRARWVGELFTPRSTVYRLQLVAGEFDETEVLIDGEYVSGALELERGNHSLELRWEHTQGPARVQFLWTYAARRVEVVPHWALSHVAVAEGAAAGELFERGRRLAERLLCGACHTDEDAGRAPVLHRAPSLVRGAGQLREEWLRSYILDPTGTQPHSFKRALVPDSPLGRAAAEALVRLLSPGKPSDSEPPDGARVPADRGRRRFQGLGCFTCHPPRGPGAEDDQGSPYQGIHFPGAPLEGLARKLDRARLESILRRPHEVLPAGRMPDFRLGEDDVAALTDFLLGEEPASPQGAGAEARGGELALLAAAYPDVAVDALSADDAWLAHGRAIARAGRCGACHAMPAGTPPARGALPLSAVRPTRGCLAERSSGVLGQPAYVLDAADRRALRAYVEGLPAAFEVAHETRMERLIERLGCLACHARDGSSPPWSLASEVTQLPKTIHFPDLSAVGVKLRQDWLTEVLAAPTDANRVWRVSPARMPDYHLGRPRAEELAAHLARRDRVHRLDVDAPLPEIVELSGEELDRSLEDVGRRGSACFSCHLLPPSSVQFGMAYDAIGPDLSQSRSRLRQQWVSDWLRDPALIHPATRMPSIGEPADEALRARLWNYLVAGLPSAQDALRWEVPLEQSTEGPVFVHALVKRDESLGLLQHHPRSLLVVLENGASVLFDIDRLALVAFWNRGRFAYRVHGRSRYWAPLEPVDWAGEDVPSALALVDREGLVHPAQLAPTLGRMPSRLLGFDVQEHGFAVHYRITDERGQTIRVTETFAPVTPETGSGLDRTLLIEGIPQGERVVLTTCFAGASAPVLVDGDGGSPVALPEGGVPAVGQRLAKTGGSGRRVTRQLVGLPSPAAVWLPGTCSGGREGGHPALLLELDPGPGSAITVTERVLVGPREE